MGVRKPCCDACVCVVAFSEIFTPLSEFNVIYSAARGEI